MSSSASGDGMSLVLAAGELVAAVTGAALVIADGAELVVAGDGEFVAASVGAELVAAKGAELVAVAAMFSAGAGELVSTPPANAVVARERATQQTKKWRKKYFMRRQALFRIGGISRRAGRGFGRPRRREVHRRNDSRRRAVG